MNSENALKIDCHFHMLGDGTDGSGSFINPNSIIKKIKAYGLLALTKLPLNSIGVNLDEAYRTFALDLIRSSQLDKAVILAHDKVHNDDGSVNLEQSLFYTPNDYVLKLANFHPEFIPALCIHPYRRDAVDVLEEGHAKGARILKYLPAVLNIDFTKKNIQYFLKKASDLKMIFLVHTGGEISLPVIRPEFHDPACLTPILDLGARVIAAHAGTSSHYFDPDYQKTIAKMLLEYPNLFVDNSGCNTPFRSRHLPGMTKEIFSNRMIYGSDIPIHISSIWLKLRKILSKDQHLNCKETPNILDRDLLIKKYLGFHESSLTRLHQLLN